jgi:glycosyltransferase involved in cell wall biosynthesis
MRLAVTDDCGIKVPFGTIDGSVDGFASALKRLAGDPDEVRRLSRGALCRAEALSWESKAAAIADAYDRVCAARGTT